MLNNRMFYLCVVCVYCERVNNPLVIFAACSIYINYNVLALTRKICGILSKKVAKISIIQILMPNLSVKKNCILLFFVAS